MRLRSAAAIAVAATAMVLPAGSMADVGASMGPAHPKQSLKREERALHAAEHHLDLALRHRNVGEVRAMVARIKDVTLQIQQMERSRSDI